MTTRVALFRRVAVEGELNEIMGDADLLFAIVFVLAALLFFFLVFAPDAVMQRAIKAHYLAGKVIEEPYGYIV